MSWVTVIWSMLVAMCLTLAAVHLFVWCQRRTKWSHLLFSLMALSVAGMACCEYGMMKAETPDAYATAMRFTHVALLMVVVTLVVFVRLYVKAGHVWLAWSVCLVRAVSLLLNFTTGQALQLRRIDRLDQLAFLGEPVSLARGEVNPWVAVAHLGLLLILVYVADAAVTVWRRGERRLAWTVGGSFLVFTVLGTMLGVMTSWQLVSLPYIPSLFFMGVIVTMAYEMSRDTIKAASLAENLHESEARYRGIFDGAIEGIYRTSPRGAMLVANPALAKMLGYDSPQDLVSTVYDTAHQVWGDLDERSRLLQQLQAQATVTGYECQFKRKDGTRIWVSLSARVVPDPDGHVAYYEGFAEDITHEKQMMEELQRSREQYRLALEGSDDGVWDWDIEHNRLYYSPRWKSMLGYTDQELANAYETWERLLHPEDREWAQASVKAYLADPRSTYELEYRLRHKDGSYRWILTRGKALRDAKGCPYRMTGTNRDITERRRTEALLRESEARLASAIAVADLGFYERGVGTGITFMDNRVREVTGIPPGQESHAFRYWAEHLHPEDRDRILDEDRKLADEGTIDRASVEFRFLHPQHGVVWLNLVAHVLERDAARRSTRMIGVFQDITDRKRAESESQRLHHELLHASRAVSLGELSSAIAHQLNQPLTAILSNAEAGLQMLKAGTANTAETEDILADIVSDTERAGDTIHRLRALLTKDTQARRPFELNSLVQETIRLLQSDAILRGVTMATDLAQELPPAQGDPIQIQQVLLNVVCNALDAASDAVKENRTVTVRTEASAPREIMVSVHDCGPGIPPEAMSRLFQHFFTSKPKGMGMGLPISRRIVTAHGGRIWAENNPDCGATVRFTLQTGA